MGPLEHMIAEVMERKLQKDYPQAQLAAVMTARITSAAETGETREEPVEVRIETEEGQQMKGAVIQKRVYVYSLRILTQEGETDSRFPAIPGVRSLLRAKPGDTVAVAMLCGGLNPYIIGEVV